MNATSRRELLRQAACAGLGAAVLHSNLPVARGTQAKERIKIGQIGVGHAHASGKMDALRRLTDDYEVVGVVEPDPKLRELWQSHSIYRGLKWMTQEELFRVKGLRAVVVETGVAELVPTAACCIAHGMHIHLDKPAGASLPAFRQLLGEATRRGLTVQMGFMFRNNPAFQFCFRAVREGWLGRVLDVHGVMGKLADQRERRQIGAFPGGTMFELGCHLIDALVTVLGKPQKVTPYARRTRPQDDQVFDDQLAVFEYPRATATLRASVVEVDGFRRRRFVVCGERGTIAIQPLEPPHLELTLAAPIDKFHRGYQEVALPPLKHRYADQLLELARIIRGQQKHLYQPAHDLAVHEAVLRASGMDVE